MVILVLECYCAPQAQTYCTNYSSLDIFSRLLSNMSYLFFLNYVQSLCKHHWKQQYCHLNSCICFFNQLIGVSLFYTCFMRIRMKENEKGGKLCPIMCQVSPWICQNKLWICQYRPWICQYSAWICQYRLWMCHYKPWQCNYRLWKCHVQPQSVQNLDMSVQILEMSVQT